MSITFHDRAPLSGTQRRANGFLATQARVARTGVQIYAGGEVGRPDLATARIYRPESEVFAADAMASLAHQPITLTHPPSDVDASNWKATSVGWTGDAIARDGDYLVVPMMLADANAIAAVEGGTRELSVGYRADIAWTPGTAPDGQAYDGVQHSIRANHVAVVTAGRAGGECRIGDAALSDAWTPDVFRLAGLPLKDNRATIADAGTTFTDEWPEEAFRAAGMTGRGVRPSTHAVVTNDAADEWSAARALAFRKR